MVQDRFLQLGGLSPLPLLWRSQPGLRVGDWRRQRSLYSDLRMGAATAQERADGAGRVELYKCDKCNIDNIRFPR